MVEATGALVELPLVIVTLAGLQPDAPCHVVLQSLNVRQLHRLDNVILRAFLQTSANTILNLQKNKEKINAKYTLSSQIGRGIVKDELHCPRHRYGLRVSCFSSG